jgi:hypothetical protein
MSFKSRPERLAAWGLKTSDLTFVRRGIRTLLLNYLEKGDAVIEYD